MLQGDLFTIQSIQKEENVAKAVLTLNSAHSIFEGHFPEQPVLPGACQLQMVKEIMQTVLNAEIRLLKGHQLKFLSLVDPNKAGALQMELKYSRNESNEITVIATFSNDTITCFKFNGIFRIELHDAW